MRVYFTGSVNLFKLQGKKFIFKINQLQHYPDFVGEPVGSESGTNINQKISYHKLGTLQNDDILVAEFPYEPLNSM